MSNEFPALRLAEALAEAVDRVVLDVLGHPVPLFQFCTNRANFLRIEEDAA